MSYNPVVLKTDRMASKHLERFYAQFTVRLLTNMLRIARRKSDFIGTSLQSIKALVLEH